MLVLSRRERQKVFLDCPCGRTTVAVARIQVRDGKPEKVRLAFDAPACVSIAREECAPVAVNPEEDGA